MLKHQNKGCILMSLYNLLKYYVIFPAVSPSILWRKHAVLLALILCHLFLLRIGKLLKVVEMLSLFSAMLQSWTNQITGLYLN